MAFPALSGQSFPVMAAGVLHPGHAEVSEDVSCGLPLLHRFYPDWEDLRVFRISSVGCDFFDFLVFAWGRPTHG